VQPRLTGRQRNRANVPAASPEEYYIPFMDHVRPERPARAFRRPQPCSLLPVDNHPCIRQPVYAFDALLPAVEMYHAFIDDNHDKLRAEFELWKQRLHWMHTQHAMHPCIQTYPSCCTAGARHFTRHHCHGRAFLFHSQTAKDIPSVVNGLEDEYSSLVLNTLTDKIAYTVSPKNDTDVTHYRFNPHQPISVIFGREVADRVCY